MIYSASSIRAAVPDGLLPLLHDARRLDLPEQATHQAVAGSQRGSDMAPDLFAAEGNSHLFP